MFVANRGYALTSSRELLIREFLSAGWQVVAATASDDHARQLATMGVLIEPVTFERGGFSLRGDLRALLALLRVYRRHRPRLIHHFHIKPVVLGNWAARFVRDARVVNNIEGLGYAFTRGGLIRRLAEASYAVSLARSDLTIFLNEDDRRLFLDRRWIREEKARLIVSTGIDTERFRPERQPRLDGAPRVLMVTRLLWQKGVGEYVAAAEQVKRQIPHVRCQLAGEWDSVHPDAVQPDWVHDAVRRGTIEFLGYLTDMDRQLPSLDTFVLPSYYREGVPRVLLEAAACGVPAITTDVPGCRDAVTDGETGLLVPPRDSAALAAAICRLLRDPALRQRLGQAARRRAEQDFDIRAITRRYLAVYSSLGVKL